MNLWLRRLILLALALALGYLTTWLLVESPLLDTTVAEFAWGPEVIPLPYFFLTGLSFAFFYALVLDKFMGTKMLPK